jgi:hypothetical protein
VSEGCYLFKTDHIPERARFPVIDAHNHLWGNWEDVERIVQIMDAVGVLAYCDLTSNLALQWVEGGYDFQPADIGDFFEKTVDRFPGRYYGFTTATFCQPISEPLFGDAAEFVGETIAVLRDHVACGALGLKILKSLGLQYRDAGGDLVAVDDQRLMPIWEECGELGIPVLIHQSDPYGFFEPVVPENEHYSSLLKYPTWSFADARFPRKAELLERRDRLLKRHPNTTFMLPHVANFAENLDAVGRLLDTYPNTYIDFSARCDELGRQPYSAREFLIRYQDRVYFGTDMPASEAMYRFHFRFLETYDEYFIPPDYDGVFGRYRWRVHGLGLPDDVLRKIYYENIMRIIPNLKELGPD